jgi:hypothetical protein
LPSIAGPPPRDDSGFGSLPRLGKLDIGIPSFGGWDGAGGALTGLGAISSSFRRFHIKERLPSVIQAELGTVVGPARSALLRRAPGVRLILILQQA